MQCPLSFSQLKVKQQVELQLFIFCILFSSPVHSCNTLVDALQKPHVWECCSAPLLDQKKKEKKTPFTHAAKVMHITGSKIDLVHASFSFSSFLSISPFHSLVFSSLLICLFVICCPHLNLFFQVVLATLVRHRHYACPCTQHQSKAISSSHEASLHLYTCLKKKTHAVFMCALQVH